MKKLIIIQYILFIFITFEWIFVDFNKDVGEIILFLVKVQVFLIYIWMIYSTRKILHYKWISIYMLFLLSMGIFILSRIILDIFGLFDLKEGTFFLEGINFSIIETVEMLFYLSESLILIHFGVVFSSASRESERSLKSYPLLEKLGTIIFFIAFPGAVVKAFIIFKYLLTHGYLAMYTYGTHEYNFPFWTKGSTLLLMIGLTFILASIPSKNKFILISILFMIIEIFKLLSGIRGSVMVTLLFLLWYYYDIIMKKDMKTSFVILFGSVIMIFMQIIGYIRNSKNIEEVNTYSDLILNFLSDQGTSLLILQSMIKYKYQFVREGFPYILSPFEIFFGIGHSHTIENALNSIDLGTRLSYFLAPSRYLNGAGIGSSFLGELYDLGLIAFASGSFFLGFFIIWFSRLVKVNRVALLLSYPIVTSIIWMPRGNFLPSILNILIILIAYMIFKFASNK